MNLLLTLFIFSLSLGVLSRIQLFPNVFIYLHDTLIGIIFVLFIFKLITKKQTLVNKNIAIPLVGFFVVGFVSLLVSLNYLSIEQFFVSFLYSLRYMAYLSLIFVVAGASKKFIDSINLKLVISGLIFILIGYVQFFYYPNLRNLNYLGWDEHEFRFFSTFLDPNFAGMLIVLVFILVLSNLLINYKVQKRWEKLLYCCAGVLALIAIYLTHSRSALISLIVGVVTMLFVLKQTKIIIPIIVILFIAQFAFSDFSAEGLNPFRVASGEARVASAIEAVSVFVQSPLIGVGFDSYRYARIRLSNGLDQGSMASNAGAGTDNSFLFVLATVGIIGFLFFIKFWIEILRLVYIRTNSIRNSKLFTLAVAALSSIIAVLTNSLFINTLFYPIIISWAFILIGVILSGVVKSRNVKK